MAYGDSKAAGFTDTLMASLNALPLYPTVNNAGHDDLSIPNITVAGLVARVASDLATRPAMDGMSYQNVLITIGANDVISLPAQATWKADTATLLDALHAKWPNAKVYVAQAWRRGYAASCNSLATWLGNVLSTRGGWAFVGPDERVYLENGDDGATYTDDGVHPNNAGYILAAAQWKAILGY